MGTKVGTVLKVAPADWATNPASIQKEWYIYYRVDNKMVKIRNMNRIKDHTGRVKETSRLLKDLEKALSRATKQQYLELPDSTMGLVSALNQAYKTIGGSDDFKKDVRSCIKYVTLSAVKLHLEHIPVGKVTRKHIKMLLQSAVIDRGLSATSWNHYRAYLASLFSQLEDLEIVDANPVTSIKKMQEAKKFKDTLDPQQRILVRTFLEKEYPNFFRFINIFFHSGGRLRELFRLKVKDINLDQSYYKVWVFKGRRPMEKKRVIKDIALAYWQELLSTCMNHQDWYVFSRNLTPGPDKINSTQTTRRWKNHVKIKLGIEVDLYSLKHLNTDETSELLDIQHAAMQNSHTSTTTTKTYYAFGEEQRMLERLKKVKNPL